MIEKLKMADKLNLLSNKNPPDPSGLDEMLKEARPKDIIVIWKLDRLGRSLKHLVDLVAELNEDPLEYQRRIRDEW